MISVIIPCINERLELENTLTGIVPDRGRHEVIVVDGGSVDGSVNAVEDPVKRREWVRMIKAKGGRGALMNAGAAEASGDILLFLYPGTDLERGWARAVEDAVAAGKFAGGYFRLEFRKRDFVHRLIELDNLWRSRVRGIPQGDQALFFTRAVFEEHGGFLDLPICADVEFVRRLREQHVPLKQLKLAAMIPGREYERDGALYRLQKNRTCFNRFMAGAEPRELLACSHGAQNAVVVWYTHDFGDSIANRIGRHGGNGHALEAGINFAVHQLDLAAGAPVYARTFLCAIPEAARHPLLDVAESNHALMYQRGDGLGPRLVNAFHDVFEQNMEKVVIVDPICPLLDDIHLRHAFDYLQNFDIVVGPTDNGRCYLLGAKGDHGDVFRDVDWLGKNSHRAVLDACRKGGLRFHELERLQSLETADDFRYFRSLGYVEY